MTPSPEPAPRVHPGSRSVAVIPSIGLVLAAAVAAASLSPPAPGDRLEESTFLIRLGLALGLALFLTPVPEGRSSRVPIVLPWLGGLAIAAFVPASPGTAVVVGGFYTLTLLLAIVGWGADARSESLWPWFGIALGAHVLSTGDTWVTGTRDLGSSLLWFALPTVSVAALSVYGRERHPGSPPRIGAPMEAPIGATLFVAGSGWSPEVALAALTLPLCAMIGRGRIGRAAAFGVPVIAVGLAVAPTTAVAAVLGLLLWAALTLQRIPDTVRIALSVVLALSAGGFLRVLGAGAAGPRSLEAIGACLLLGVVPLLPTVVSRLAKTGRNADSPRALVLLAVTLFGVGSASYAGGDGPLLIAIAIAAHALLDRPRRATPLHAVTLPWQAAWSVALVGAVVFWRGYPWHRPTPLPDLVHDDLGALLALAMLVWAALAIGRPRPGGSLRRVGGIALSLAALLGFARTAEHVEPLLVEGPRRLDRSGPELEVTIERQPIREVILDGYLSNTLELRRGQDIGRIVLLDGARTIREIALESSENLGEWAGSRRDVVERLGPPRPTPWRVALAPEGNYFVRQFRIRAELPEPTPIDRVRVELEPDLPGGPSLEILALRTVRAAP